jgi:hypothetical protein
MCCAGSTIPEFPNLPAITENLLSLVVGPFGAYAYRYTDSPHCSCDKSVRYLVRRLDPRARDHTGQRPNGNPFSNLALGWLLFLTLISLDVLSWKVRDELGFAH